MAWIKLIDGRIVGFANTQPPTEDVLDDWQEVTEDDPAVLNFLNPPPPELTIDDYKRLARQEIDQYRELIEYGGFFWSGYPVQSDIISQKNIQGAAFAVATLGIRQDGEIWKMADNSLVPLSNAQIIAMAAATYRHSNKCYGVAFFHKQQVDSLQTIEEVRAYDFRIGWD